MNNRKACQGRRVELPPWRGDVTQQQTVELDKPVARPVHPVHRGDSRGPRSGSRNLASRRRPQVRPGLYPGAARRTGHDRLQKVGPATQSKCAATAGAVGAAQTVAAAT